MRAGISDFFQRLEKIGSTPGIRLEVRPAGACYWGIMPRKLFCELSPLTYRISVQRMILARKLKDAFSPTVFARQGPEEFLPAVVYRHNSLIRRKRGSVDLHLQENKAVSLGIAAPWVHAVVIHPGETFSFWKLVGSCTEAKGYREGLVINHGDLDLFPDFNRQIPFGSGTSTEQIIENNALVVCDRALINAPILDAPPRPETEEEVVAAATA